MQVRYQSALRPEPWKGRKGNGPRGPMQDLSPRLLGIPPHRGLSVRTSQRIAIAALSCCQCAWHNENPNIQRSLRNFRWTSLSPSLCFRVPETPGWRNWQTRWTQNPVPARECGFDPHSGHHQQRTRSRSGFFAARAQQAYRPKQEGVTQPPRIFFGHFERFSGHCVSPRCKRVCKASTSLVCSLISRLKRPGNRALQPFLEIAFRAKSQRPKESRELIPHILNVLRTAASLPA